jgi:hypothetical protein
MHIYCTTASLNELCSSTSGRSKYPVFLLQPGLLPLSDTNSLPNMALPWNIRGSASQLFFQDKQSAQYKALLEIVDVPHPDRSILGAFINDAVDPEEAARYFLYMTCAGEVAGAQPRKTVSQFLSEWKAVVDKCESASSATRLYRFRASNLGFSSADASSLTVHCVQETHLRKRWGMLLPYADTIQIILGSRPRICSNGLTSRVYRSRVV